MLSLKVTDVTDENTLL